MSMTNIPTLIERLRSSAAAFRENSVFDSEGDEVRLTVQARECDEAAAALEAAVEEIERLRELLRDWRNSWLCPVGPFDADRLLDATDTVLGITPILGERDRD